MKTGEKESMGQSHIILDPTSLTTAQLQREIAALKELVFVRLGAIEEGIETAHNDLVRVPTDVQKQIAGLREYLEGKIECDKELKEEKFKYIIERFDIIEQARQEQKRDTATAIDAALRSAKEAVIEQNSNNNNNINKSENNMTKQLEQIGRQMTEQFRAHDDKINDVKDRLTKAESTSTGKTVGSDSITKFIPWLIMAAAVVVAILSYTK